ncbi:IclR family transcriptional regulator [Natrinema sp. SYSU A 869]|uniref:IclR family transcriptional regulator n=1 Tax=Natrinema sp. SYSU A 869 TaxID=2871694 RepID=UPI001CA45064|nr:IclR family transcriptional regulator [Natrinema sp. SYSU A 869]
MAQTDADKTGQLSSVRRAFNILESIDESDGIGASELASKENIPKSTAYIYLKTLSKTGFVTNNEGTYRLSLRFLEFGGRVRQKRELFQVAKEEVEALSERTGEVASLGVEEDGQRALLYKSEGADAIYDKIPTGERTNLHWTALGKAILAFLPPERVDSIIETHGLPKLTEKTITKRSELLDELKIIRNRNYSIEDEERRTGMRSIGVPIRADSGSVLGSISLTGPMSKFDDDLIKSELVGEIQNAVNVIEIKYQHY